MGGDELLPTQTSAADASINATTSGSAQKSGPFDLNDSGVVTPPFEDFLDFAKLPSTNPAAQQIRDLGFETWRAFEVGPGMSVDVLKAEGLRLGTAMGLIGKAKVYREHYHQSL